MCAKTLEKEPRSLQRSPVSHVAFPATTAEPTINPLKVVELRTVRVYGNLFSREGLNKSRPICETFTAQDGETVFVRSFTLLNQKYSHRPRLANRRRQESDMSLRQDSESPTGRDRIAFHERESEDNVIDHALFVTMWRKDESSPRMLRHSEGVQGADLRDGPPDAWRGRAMRIGVALQRM